MAHKQSEILCPWYGELLVDVLLGGGYWVRKDCNRKMRTVEKTGCWNATQRGRGKEFSFHWQKNKSKKSQIVRGGRGIYASWRALNAEVFRSVRRDGICQGRKIDRVGEKSWELAYIYWAFTSCEDLLVLPFFSAWSVF